MQGGEINTPNDTDVLLLFRSAGENTSGHRLDKTIQRFDVLHSRPLFTIVT